jgi:hypothetical protein
VSLRTHIAPSDPVGASRSIERSGRAGAAAVCDARSAAVSQARTRDDWQVPSPHGNKSACKIRIKAFGAATKPLETDVSDGPFTINVLLVGSSNGGESLTSSTQATIRWTTYATTKPVARVKLQYSITGGRRWKTIATINGNPGAYDWTVPAVTSPAPMSKIRVTLVNHQGVKVAMDESDAVFTIYP